MPEVKSLQARIDAELAASEQQVKRFQTEAVQAHEGRQDRLKVFESQCEQLRDIWRPKLEVLSDKFSGRVKVTPHIAKGLRQATFDFQSKLASVRLQFTVSTDTDVRKLMLDYNLEILPILMKFEPHAQIEFPLEAVDSEAIGTWIDDRIVDFVRTYLSMSQNQYYLKDHLVVDPIAGVELPKFAAATTLEHRGKTFYFISDKTRSQFEKQASIEASGAKGADR